MVFYGAFFVLLAVRMGGCVDNRLLTVALAAMLLTVFLDSLENHHIIMMVHSIQSGLPVSVVDGQFQMVASQIKFHSSYLAALLFSFGFLQFGKLGRIIAFVLWAYIPCGILISVLPVEFGQNPGARTDRFLYRRFYPVGSPVLPAVKSREPERRVDDGKDRSATSD